MSGGWDVRAARAAWAAGTSARQVAAAVGVAPSTITRTAARDGWTRRAAPPPAPPRAAPPPPRPERLGPGERRCDRCRDVIGGGPVGWERHRRGLDTIDAALEKSDREALAEHKARTGTAGGVNFATVMF